MSDSWALGYGAVGGFNDWPAERTIELLADIGYEAVDWTVAQFDPLTQPAAALVALADRSRAAGLQTPQFMVHQDLVTLDPVLREERLARTERALEACAEAGIPSIGVLTGPHLWNRGHARIGVDLSEHAALDLVLRGLERILERANRIGVRVALEPCWGTLARDAYRAWLVLDRLAYLSLGLTIDPSHFVMSGDDTPSFIREWGERIVHVHIKDAFGQPGLEGTDFIFPLPGEGLVDWPGVFGALRAVGYRGVVTVEFESYRLLSGPFGGDPSHAARICYTLTRALLRAGSGSAERPTSGADEEGGVL